MLCLDKNEALTFAYTRGADKVGDVVIKVNGIM